MTPAIRGATIPQHAPSHVVCWNCGERNTVNATRETVNCPRCGNTWNWKKARLVRGQR